MTVSINQLSLSTITHIYHNTFYENERKDNAMLNYWLQRKDYRMKALYNAYPYDLNKSAEFMNKDSPIGKLFLPLPRYGALLTPSDIKICSIF